VDVDGAEPTAGLRVGVGHRDGQRFLEREHVADAWLTREPIHERQLRGARIAEHHGDAFLLQDPEERLLAGEVCHSARIIHRAISRGCRARKHGAHRLFEMAADASGLCSGVVGAP
jgi:hypothetical protein